MRRADCIRAARKTASKNRVKDIALRSAARQPLSHVADALTGPFGVLSHAFLFCRSERLEAAVILLKDNWAWLCAYLRSA